MFKNYIKYSFLVLLSASVAFGAEDESVTTSANTDEVASPPDASNGGENDGTANEDETDQDEALNPKKEKKKNAGGLKLKKPFGAKPEKKKDGSIAEEESDENQAKSLPLGERWNKLGTGQKVVRVALPIVIGIVTIGGVSYKASQKKKEKKKDDQDAEAVH